MRAGTCKHFTSLYDAMRNGQCAAGIKYADVTPYFGKQGWGLRVPCRTTEPERSYDDVQEFGERGTCPRYEEPTEQELAEYAAAIEAAKARMATVSKLVAEIKKKHRGQWWQGVVDCPACGGTKCLHISHAAYNGHVHGACDTDGCVRWME